MNFLLNNNSKHRPQYITGGSSSGCAVAVAENLVDFAIGTDTGGSIRVPAACCGVYGFKPSFGRVSRKGITPKNSSLDCVGVFAADMDKLIRGLTAIDSSFSPSTISKNSQDVLQLCFIDVNAKAEIISQVKASLQHDFIELSQGQLPSLVQAFEIGMLVINYEMYQEFSHLAYDEKLGEDIAQRLQQSKDIDSNVLIQAEQIKQQLSEEIAQLLTHYDAIVLPTLASYPMTREQALNGKTDLSISSLTRPFNLSGHPAISLPLENESNKPIALQIVGAMGADEWVCDIAKRISESTKNTHKSVGD